MRSIRPHVHDRPRALVARHQPPVAVDRDRRVEVPEARELRGHLGELRQRRQQIVRGGRVAREHEMVERMLRPGDLDEQRAVGIPRDGIDRRAGAQARALERGDEGVDVDAEPARDLALLGRRQPAREVRAQVVQRVVRGEPAEVGEVDAPEREQQREEEVVDERLRQALALDVLGDRHGRVVLGEERRQPRQERPEAQQVDDRARRERRPHRPAAPERRHGDRPRAVDPRHRQRRRVRRAGHLELVQQPVERRVRGAAREELEPGVDGEHLPVDLDVDRVRVAAETVVLLEQRDVVVLLEQPCGRESRGAAADDADPHVRAVL